MNWANEQAFIERQLISFHSFLDEVWFYRETLDRIAAKVEYELSPVTVAYATNYRDTFWHYAKASGIPNDNFEAHAQYCMMLEHLNRAVIDLLINVLQKLYHINRLIAYSSRYALQEDDMNTKYDDSERKRLKQRFDDAKHGYLNAREALLLLRSKRKSLYRVISDQSEFDTPNEYHDNTVYYINAVSLLVKSHDLMFAAIINE